MIHARYGPILNLDTATAVATSELATILANHRRRKGTFHKTMEISPGTGASLMAAIRGILPGGPRPGARQGGEAAGGI